MGLHFPRKEYTALKEKNCSECFFIRMHILIISGQAAEKQRFLTDLTEKEKQNEKKRRDEYQTDYD